MAVDSAVTPLTALLALGLPRVGNLPPPLADFLRSLVADPYLILPAFVGLGFRRVDPPARRIDPVAGRPVFVSSDSATGPDFPAYRPPGLGSLLVLDPAAVAFRVPLKASL